MPDKEDFGSARHSTLTWKQEVDLAKKLKFTCWSLTALLVVGLIISAIQVTWQAKAAACLWALACLSIGYVVGFLFAVPRVPRTSNRSSSTETSTTNDQESGSNAAPENGALGVNTNLTEISDWLTKILVGLGLVELRNVPDYLRRIGHYVGQSLGCGGTGCQGNSFDSAASGIVLYFLGLGFLSGYLLTRMFLGPAFWLADRATTTGTSDGLAREALGVAKTAQAVAKEEADLNSTVGTAMEELVRNPLQISSIERLIGQLAGYRERFPLKRKLAIVLARLYAEGKKQLDDGIGVLQSFVQAKINAKEVDVDVADALFNISCYGSLKMESLDGEARRAAAESAVDALKRSLEIAPQNGRDVLTDPDFIPLLRSEDFGPRVQQLLLNTGSN